MFGSPALGFLSLFATSLESSYVFSPSIPRLSFVPSSGFRSLSTVSSALELAGLFHPAATSRVIFRSGASLPSQPPFLIGRSLPPCRCCFAARNHGPTFAGSLSRPRTTPLGFEVLICAGPRSSSPVIHLARSRSPHRIFCSSRSLRSLDDGLRSHGARPLMMLRVRRSTNVPTLRCSRSRSSARYRIPTFARANNRGGPRAEPLRVALAPP
jgi:hypothetical protein